MQRGPPLPKIFRKNGTPLYQKKDMTKSKWKERKEKGMKSWWIKLWKCKKIGFPTVHGKGIMGDLWAQLEIMKKMKVCVVRTIFH